MAKEPWELRRTNLQALIDCFPEKPGNRAAFCRKYGLDPLQIGQYFTDSKHARRLGEQKAKEIEEKIGTLPPGWLGLPHDRIGPEVFSEATTVVANSLIERATRIQKEYESLPATEQAQIDEALRRSGKIPPFSFKVMAAEPNLEHFKRAQSLVDLFGSMSERQQQELLSVAAKLNSRSTAKRSAVKSKRADAIQDDVSDVRAAEVAADLAFARAATKTDKAKKIRK